MYWPDAERLEQSRSKAPETSNNIIQNGLAFDRHRSGTVINARRLARLEILPRRLHGRDGASVVRRDAAINRTEDLNVKGYEATISCTTRSVRTSRKPCTIGGWQSQDQEGRAWLEAISRHRNAAIALWD